MLDTRLGFLAVDKPSGITSADVVGILKKRFHLRKIGHTGTLDPLATGMLVVLWGDATKLADFIQQGSKRYRAVARLGVVSSTQDREGELTVTCPDPRVTLDQVTRLLPRYTGVITQVPPVFSAKKVNGREAYKMARQGYAVELKPQEVTVHAITATGLDADMLTIEAHVGCGTYVRTLVHDLGQDLGVGACVESLRRLSLGAIPEEAMITLEHLRDLARPEDALRPLEPRHLGACWIELDQDQHRTLCHGKTLAVPVDRVMTPERCWIPSSTLLGFTPDRGPVAIMSRLDDPDPGTLLLHPRRIVQMGLTT